MKPTEIRKILKLAKNLGVKDLEVGGLKVSFHGKTKKKVAKAGFSAPEADSNAPSAEVPPAVSQIISDEEAGRMPTEDELRFWSSPYYDDIQDLKALADAEAQPTRQ